MSTPRKPRALVLTGEGISCERETAQGFLRAGFDVEVRHLNDLIVERFSLDQLSARFQVLVLPGGASHGADLGAGKLLALRISHGLGWDFSTFVARGGLILGVSNGFQAMIRMGVFGKDLTIARNIDGKFQDIWVRVLPSGSRCVWLKGVGQVELPVRHSEGRVMIASFRRREVLAKMERYGMMCLRYESDFNGSDERIAGLCDPTGRIFGLMPHPEAFLRWTAHPDWTYQPGRSGSPGQGAELFNNAFQEALRSI
jgi:phosphoribosylformylglycinamidine synthase